MTVRVAEPADSVAIATIHVETWRAVYRGQIPDTVLDGLDIGRRAAIWKERLADRSGGTFVAESGGEIVGYCHLIPSRDGDANVNETGEIAAAYVSPNHWRIGAGRALCGAALTEARSRGYLAVTLWVLAGNDRARHFYEAMGFVPDGATKTEKIARDCQPLVVRYCMALAPTRQ